MILDGRGDATSTTCADDCRMPRPFVDAESEPGGETGLGFDVGRLVEASKSPLGGERRPRTRFGRCKIVGCEPSDSELPDSDSDASSCRRAPKTVACWGCGGVGGWTTTLAGGTCIEPENDDEGRCGSDADCVCTLREELEDVRRGMEGRGAPAALEFLE